MPTITETIGCRFFSCRQLRQPYFLSLDVGLGNEKLYFLMDGHRLGIEHAGHNGYSAEKSPYYSNMALYSRYLSSLRIFRSTQFILVSENLNFFVDLNFRPFAKHLYFLNSNIPQ